MCDVCNVLHAVFVGILGIASGLESFLGKEDDGSIKVLHTDLLINEPTEALTDMLRPFLHNMIVHCV